MLIRTPVFLFLLFCAASGSGAREAPDKPHQEDVETGLTAKVDRLFAPWNKRSTPGGVVAVLRDGKVLCQRSYGMANLEYEIPNRPATLFPIASVSKQFTAFAIHLLARDKKLSLDDDARRHLPELPDFGKRITIRHLLHHTSGLRDLPLLAWLAGWRFEDVLTQADALDVIRRQRELNFPPGEEELYSNTGYLLLAEIVKRVSGKPMSEFARERIFKPLGMNHTFVQDDYRLLIEGRAYPYGPKEGGGYQTVSLSDSTVGQTGVVTTVGDLALWDRNFYEGRVGGKALISEMLRRGRLDDGREGTYASGLGIREYRGLRVVEHTGANPGYNSHYMRFPDPRMSVIVLSNAADMNAADLAHRVADLYLGDRLRPLPPAAPAADRPAEVRVDPGLLDLYVGDYEIRPGEVVAITKEGGRLMAQGTGSGRVPLFPSSEDTFFLKDSPGQVTFVRSEDSRPADALILHLSRADRRAKRITSAPLSDYAGEFYSPELHVLYTVSLRDEKLFLRHPRGEVEMVRTFPDAFEMPFPIGTLRFTRGANGSVNGFTVDDGRVRNLCFLKAEITFPEGRSIPGGTHRP